jgi:site-specific recombinase XerD
MDEYSRSLQAIPDRLRALENCIEGWITTKTRRSGSEKTRAAYTWTITQFRERLAQAGLDLDSDATLIARAAEAWASTGHDGRAIAPSTHNQRLAILSSFYRYAMTWRIITVNPIALAERRPRQTSHAALPMPSQEMKARLAAIDRNTPEGLRDFALLSVALTTGRRVGELAGMRYGHLSMKSSRIVVTWPRCKGGKVMHDTLPSKTATALMDYLHSVYGRDLLLIRADSPVWVSLSHNNRGGALSSQAIADICKKRLGDSRSHILRHTFAVSMEGAGAKLSEIGERLGHSDLKTTSDYMKQLHSAENQYSDKLEDLFGI